MKSSIAAFTLLTIALLLPASAQEAGKEPVKEPAGETAPPAAAETPAAPPKESEESEVPPDLGENVSADNNVSFPVDI